MTALHKARRNSPNRCEVANCGRPRSAYGYCQSHYRQIRETGHTNPIRPYRPRASGTIKYAGLRITPACAQAIERFAKKYDLSNGAAIAAVLESWAQPRNRRR